MSRARPIWLQLTLAGALLLLPCSHVCADSAEAQIEAAFVYHFAQFIEWPAGAFSSPTGPFNVCTTGNPVMAAPLMALMGRQAQGHVIHVRDVNEGGVVGCHMLVLGNMDDGRRSQLLGQLGNSPVLTVSDSPDFTHKGGMIGLFVESNHMQFSVNIAAAQQAGLKLGARLLSLAHVER